MISYGRMNCPTLSSACFAGSLSILWPCVIPSLSRKTQLLDGHHAAGRPPYSRRNTSANPGRRIVRAMADGGTNTRPSPYAFVQATGCAWLIPGSSSGKRLAKTSRNMQSRLFRDIVLHTISNGANPLALMNASRHGGDGRADTPLRIPFCNARQSAADRR